MANNELDVFFRDGFGRLCAAVASDIKRHIATLRESGVDFYGYAAFPPDYYTAYDPTSLVVAFNCESDIDAENKNAPYSYYRYSVDEWQNYVHDGFDATNAELKALLSEFKRLTETQDSDDAPETFVASINQTILDALISLRKDGTFDGISYVVIWLSDSGDEIMNRSAKELNTADVYAAYATEFT